MTTTWEERLEAARDRKRKREESGLDLVDGILDNMQLEQEAKAEGKAYPHRDEFPEALLDYCDWYVKKTGQEPDPKTKTDWIDTMWYWNSKALQTWALDKAFLEYDIVWRPDTLTKTAVAIQAKGRARTYQTEIYKADEHEEIKAVPPPTDLYEATRKRLREKAAMDRIGKSAHEPKPISEVMKGMQS